MPHKSPSHPHLLCHLLGALGHEAEHVDDKDDDAGDEEVVRRPVKTRFTGMESFIARALECCVLE